MPQDTPIVLITPEAQSALEAEVDRGGIAGALTGGLLFGHPVDEGRRLVVSSMRLSEDVGFGRRDFSLDQTRTSRQLEQARSLDPQATYCGVWYLHRTPNRELVDEEWVQTQTLLEDPDFRFSDLVCLVLCFYYAELKVYASSFNRYHSARGQAPAPTELQLTTDQVAGGSTPAHRSPSTSPPTHWYKAPDVATRLSRERQRLKEKYRVEPALSPNGQMLFRLTPKRRYQALSFYLACGPGFPSKAPQAFLLAGSKSFPLSSPDLSNWSAGQSLVRVADGLLEWLAFSVDQYVTASEEALKRGDHQQATDLLSLVLTLDPRAPRAARLLARAQAPLS